MARTDQLRTPAYMARDEYTGHRLSQILTQIVDVIGSTIVSLLAFRFVLSLLGANPTNVLANFIYTVSHPFVAPFFGLFNYTPQFNGMRFEFDTLVAIIFYVVAMVFLTSLLSINRRLDDY